MVGQGRPHDSQNNIDYQCSPCLSHRGSEIFRVNPNCWRYITLRTQELNYSIWIQPESLFPLVYLCGLRKFYASCKGVGAK